MESQAGLSLLRLGQGSSSPPPKGRWLSATGGSLHFGTSPTSSSFPPSLAGTTLSLSGAGRWGSKRDAYELSISEINQLSNGHGPLGVCAELRHDGPPTPYSHQDTNRDAEPTVLPYQGDGSTHKTQQPHYRGHRVHHGQECPSALRSHAAVFIYRNT